MLSQVRRVRATHGYQTVIIGRPYRQMVARSLAVDAVVWNGAASHQGADLQAVERHTDYSLAAKQAAVTAVLCWWQDDPGRARQPSSWTWIREALDPLPAAETTVD